MQIIEINEPGKENSTEEIVVGIDFGTTNSLIAISENYKSRIISMPNKQELVPSVLVFDESGIIVGDNHKSSNCINSIKRLLAKSSSEIEANLNLKSLTNNIDLSGPLPRVLMGEKSLSLPELASEIFKYLKHGAEISLSAEIKKAVVSVPAHFDDNARGQVLLAAKIAGLEVIRLISEPTAAAYAYGLNRSRSGTYLVYDLGGGTFDVSILNMDTGVLQVISTGGDNLLGGNDLDILIAQYICNNFGYELTDNIISLAKGIKEELSVKEAVNINYRGNDLKITQAELNKVILPIINKTIKITKETLHDAETADLDGIILVGGSTRVPLISQLLKENFNTRIYSDLDPDKIVALGAAMQAENLSSKSSSLLIDVAPLSVGLELYGGITEKIILRNTPIPFSVTKEFTTHVDNQTGIQFHVVQGEREMVKDCRSLAHFELNDIPPNKAGKARVEVNFAIDADGILSITARECLTGKARSVVMKPSYGLDESEIIEALKTAYENAEQDHQARLLAEAKEQANSLISGLTKAIEETPDILTEKDLEKMQNAIKALQNAVNLDNRDNILANIDSLNEIAAAFIQKHLDKGVNLHIKGRHVDEIKY
jgi:molecular chaperone HscA